METLLVMPLLFLLVFGMVQLTYIYRGQMQLDLACFRAARAAIVHAQEENWLEEARKAARKSITYYPNARRIQVEKAAENKISAIRIGEPIVLKLTLAYPLNIPLGASLFGKKGLLPFFDLNSQCALTSESGTYVKED